MMVTGNIVASHVRERNAPKFSAQIAASKISAVSQSRNFNKPQELASFKSSLAHNSDLRQTKQVLGQQVCVVYGKNQLSLVFIDSFFFKELDEFHH